MKKGISILLALTVVATLSLALGCTPKEEPAPAATPATTPATTAPAPAATEVIEMSLATAVPPMHGIAVTLEQWAAELDELTQGQVKIVPYYGGSLVRSGTEWDAVLEGVADIATTIPSYAVGRFPVHEILELPWAYPPLAEVPSNIANDVFTKYQPSELADVHVLYEIAVPACYLIGSKAVHTMEDAQGLQIRGTGGNNNKIIEAIGGTPVSMPLGDLYDALQKGVTDATLVGVDALMTFKLAEAAKYAIDITPCVGYTTVTCIFMNKDKFNSLPADVQQIIDEITPKYVGINAKIFDETVNAAIGYAKEQGVEFIELSPEEQQRWADAMKPIREEAIASAAAQGVPAEEIAGFIEDSLKSYK